MTSFSTRFLYVLGNKRKKLILMFFLFLFVSFLEVFSIGMVGPFVAVATKPESIMENQWTSAIYRSLNFNSPNQFLILMGVTLVIAFYGKAILAFNIQKYIFEYGFYLRRDLASRVMSAYLSAPYTFHLSSNSAVLINNAVEETKAFCTNLLMPLLTSVSNALITLALVLLLMKTDLLATVLISTVLMAAFLLFNQLKGKLYLWGMNASKANADIIRTINHGLGGIKETRVIGCELYFLKQLEQHSTFYASNVSAAVGFNNLPRFMIEALLMTFLVGFTSLFVLLHHGSGNLVSVLGIFALASIRLMPAASNLLTSLGTIRASTISLDRLYLDLKQLEGSSPKSVNYSIRSLERTDAWRGTFGFKEKIVLNRVTYRYPNASNDSLKSISLSIEKGESIGLIGKSGAGKTTLVDVILGLLTPKEGDIEVDGVSIYTNLRHWQNMLGYVPQSIFLIDDTLERNIAFGVPDELIDRERVVKAVQVAQLSELVDQLPDGLQTEVGERGVLLSGGQRQRVGIARAIYHEREILVFDEATAALDDETESFVTESIKALSGIKTIIIIAHRLSTIQHCNHIYEMSRGKIIKSGSYQEVVLDA
ncbi:ABC transporter ATP-binding protein [Cyanobacteria bacterium FACHB-63]|nr:ABC transporter ATP-binding protein [Cyanobacteria bacterium FACHB-63]